MVKKSKLLLDKIVQAGLSDCLLLSAIFSLLLLAIRMIVTGTIEYIFLPWNLFLAFIPYWVVGKLQQNINWIENKWKLVTVLLVWLLFIPNSFYIITDLFHFRYVRTAPKWFDLLLIFSFAWNGLIAGILSIRMVEVVLSTLLKKNTQLLLMFLIMGLCGLGIYIGRYLRFNSWDIIANPLSLIKEITDLFLHLFQNGVAWCMAGTYAIFMSLAYFTIKKAGESFFINDK